MSKQQLQNAYDSNKKKINESNESAENKEKQLKENDQKLAEAQQEMEMYGFKFGVGLRGSHFLGKTRITSASVQNGKVAIDEGDSNTLGAVFETHNFFGHLTGPLYWGWFLGVQTTSDKVLESAIVRLLTVRSLSRAEFDVNTPREKFVEFLRQKLLLESKGKEAYMKLGSVATAVAIIGGLLSAVYTCTNLYDKYRVRTKTGDTHISLAGKTPLIAQTIEVHPDTAIAVKVDVSYRIYETGDIIVESGKTVKLLPFDLTFQSALFDSLVSTAYAQTKDGAGSQYKIKAIKYIESSRKVDNVMIEETRTYGDGSQEVKLIDPMSGSIVKSTQSRIKLTPKQVQQINQSKFNKVIYTQQSETK